MAGDLKAIVVGASEEEFAHVKQCLADWECMNASLRDEKMAVASIPEIAKLSPSTLERTRRTRWRFASNSAALRGIPIYRSYW